MSSSSARPTFYVVDDSPELVALVIDLLSEAGYAVKGSTSPLAAIAEIVREKPDCVLVDLMMPGINGLDLARRVRMRYPDVRIVLTSAYHLTERQIERAAVGAIGFVPKPYSLDELAGFLRAKLARRSSIPSAP